MEAAAAASKLDHLSSFFQFQMWQQNCKPVSKSKSAVCNYAYVVLLMCAVVKDKQ